MLREPESRVCVVKLTVMDFPLEPGMRSAAAMVEETAETVPPKACVVA